VCVSLSLCVCVRPAATTNTFATASWTLAHLLLRPADLARVHAEVATAGASVSPTSIEFLDRLVFLEACLRETIRVRSAGIAFRRVTTDTDVLGCAVPKGSFLVLPHEYAHSLPEAFPDKLAYRPERHLVAADHGDADADADADGPPRRLMVDMASARMGKLLVFGAGRHPCVGMKVATHIIKILFVALTDRLTDLRLDGALDTATFQYVGVARPAKPMILHYRKRAHAA
jgi:cytochrome P450